MRVYNSSHTQIYAHHELAIKPGFTEIPEARHESVLALIKKYPHHLTSGDAPASDAARKAEIIATQAGKIRELESQVGKLQGLLTTSTTSEEERAALIARAEKAEVALTLADANAITASEEITALKAQIAAKKK